MLSALLRSCVFLPLLSVAAPAVQAQVQHTRADFRREIAQMHALVTACDAAGDQCNANAVPDDETVTAAGPLPTFSEHWEWLYAALSAAKKGNDDDRHRAMQLSDAHLEELLTEAGGVSADASEAEFRSARRTANSVLARAEFGKVAPPSWWDRLLAKVGAVWDRMWEHVGRVGEHAPWLGKAVEWLLFLAAAVTLVLFLRRNVQRQRLQGSLHGAAAPFTAWDREATDWAAMAESAAAAANWREAVHCLYWAAILRLEGRRAWRHNPARTPREYVRLLKPGSVSRDSLGRLTLLLERIWYGLRPAQPSDWESARAWYERLSSEGLVTTSSPTAIGVLAGGGPA